MIAEWKEKIEELDGRDRKIYETSVFLSKMLLAGVLFQVILFLQPDTSVLQAYLAQLVQTILNPLGVELERQGALLFDSSASYLVTQDCLGWKSMAAFTALVFSSTNKYRRHVKTILAGLGVILIANIIRITTTVYLSHLNLISFDIIHSLFWKWGLTVTILALWVFWLYKYSENHESLGNL